nr:cysteine proteinase inhibitor B-like [Ipomoea batatas]
MVLVLAGYAAAQEGGAVPLSGGKTEVSDVKSNVEVQNLGRKSVMEYNKRLKVKENPENGAKRLIFTEVIKAEKQVVAGVKYYLTIKVTTSDGQTKTYDAEMWSESLLRIGSDKSAVMGHGVTGLLNLLLVVSVALALAGYAAAQAEGPPAASGGAASGGKEEVSDVKSNVEVQNLGRKSVMEYNKRLKVKENPENGAKRLIFTEVIKAEKQVVAGVKYYLTIKATTSDGTPKTYDAEMWVKPNETVHEMLAFAPAAA